MKKKKPKKLEWADRLRLYSEEKRAIMDSTTEWNEAIHQKLIKKYRI